MKKLLGYNLNGQIIGVDLQTWNESDLNGNPPFKRIFTDVIPSGYADISSITNWHLFGDIVVNDYFAYKTAIKDLVMEIGWSNLTNIEKDLAIHYYSYPDSISAVIYLMGKGYTQQQAQGFILLEWHKHHANLLKSCRQRWYYAKFVVPQYLSFADSEDLMNTVEALIFAYTEMGRLGIEYGDKTDGIMDFIESTNGYLENGLQQKGYTLIAGTYNDLILGIKNVLVEGIYTKYDDIII
jgi:hypothetical protein